VLSGVGLLRLQMLSGSPSSPASTAGMVLLRDRAGDHRGFRSSS
jgi:hypothetical protein